MPKGPQTTATVRRHLSALLKRLKESDFSNLSEDLAVETAISTLTRRWERRKDSMSPPPLLFTIALVGGMIALRRYLDRKQR